MWHCETYYKISNYHVKRRWPHCVVAKERLLFWGGNKTLNESKEFTAVKIFYFSQLSNKRVFGFVRTFPVSLHRIHAIVDTQWFQLVFEVGFRIPVSP